MTMLTTDELTAIRADVARLLPDTGYILALTQANDGQGGFVDTWGTATGGTTTYRLDPIRGQVQVEGAALQPYHGYQLTLPYDAAITTANRFRDASGNTYTVQAVDAGKSWAASKRVRLERV